MTLVADPKLQEIAHRNYRRIQDGYDRLTARKAVQIEGVQFRFALRYRLENEDPDAHGFVLVGRDERGVWLPCHG